MSDEITVEIKDLSKSYKNHVILDKAAMTCKSGDIVGLVGINGSGKSTLLNILAGIDKNYTGEINIVSDYVSYVPQESFLIESLTVYDNLLFWFKGDKKKLNESVSSGVIKNLGIDTYMKKTVCKLSGGMKKRVLVACAMANSPKVLLLDEVTSSLDIVCKLEIQNLLKEYAAAGNIVILSTHEEGDVGICNRLVYLDDQKLKDIPVSSLKSIFSSKI